MTAVLFCMACMSLVAGIAGLVMGHLQRFRPQEHQKGQPLIDLATANGHSHVR